MRQRQLRLVVTFHTTAAAVAAEALCRRLELEGKLISVPRRLTSDCGMAWSAPPDQQQTLEDFLQRAAIETAGFHLLEL